MANIGINKIEKKQSKNQTGFEEETKVFLIVAEDQNLPARNVYSRKIQVTAEYAVMEKNNKSYCIWLFSPV